MPELNLILVGPPGAGKGTQAERLTDDFALPYFATGNMLREAVTAGTDLGKKAKGFMDAGDLVPDDVIIGMILESLASDDARDGFLLDGFPRNVEQADALAAAMAEVGRELTGVLAIELSDEEVIRRLSGRRTCVENGHSYHLDFDPPNSPDVCDQDGSALIQRDDDNPATIKRRLEVYHAQTAPLLDYYEQRGLLQRFDGDHTQSEVHEKLRAAITTLRMQDEI
ncbi:MAG TPA: adenylate kinase [Baekduia sp.]|nr:adenylate kinase [Baekduia sp.]